MNSFETINKYFYNLFFNEVIQETIFGTNNFDVEQKIINFSNFCIKNSSYTVKNRIGNYCSLSNYSSTFRIKPLYHDLFGKKPFTSLSQNEQDYWNQICEKYGLIGINKDYYLQNVIHDINEYDLKELSQLFYENPTLFNELKNYLDNNNKP